jgi:hypothetical protein
MKTICMTQEFLALVRKRAEQRLLFLPHAIRQMSRPERMITTADVKKAILAGKIIEEYQEDARGHSGLILGHGEDGRLLHVVCAPKDEYLAIVTAYIPSEDQWFDDFTSRRKK